jgi:zinc transport system substrate-binding protein
MKGNLVLMIFCLISLDMIRPGGVGALDKASVFVSIVPQRYFVEKIGGDLVDVSVMVQPGASPATYEPKPNQMAALSRAKIYFAVGVPFEMVWLKRFLELNPSLVVVHTETGIEKIPMKGPHLPVEVGASARETRHPKRQGDHHGMRDPHVWLSPPLVMLQARHILTALLEVDPAHSSVYEANFRRFMIEIIDLDAEIRGLLSGQRKGVRFMVFHPAWGYFADAYGLEQIPIEVEGKEPKPQDLRYFVESARDLRTKVIFVQPQFSTKSAETIAKAIGGQVVFADPLSPDWAENLRAQAAKFKSASRE